MGSHSLTVSYSGDSQMAPGSTTMTATVTKAASSVAGVVSPASLRVFDLATLTVQVTGGNGVMPTGDVRITVDGGPALTAEIDGSGQVVFDLSAYTGTAGRKVVTMDYLGDDVVAASTKKVAFVVRP